MEINRSSSSSSSLKQRLARMFRAPSPLRSSSCAAAGNIVEPPAIVSGHRHPSEDDPPLSAHDPLYRCQSFPSDNPLRRSAGAVKRLSCCGSRRPKHALPLELSAFPPDVVKDSKGMKKCKKGSLAGNGKACPPGSPASPSKCCYCYYCFEGSNCVEERKDGKLKRNKSKKKLLSNSYGFTSSSSMESDDGYGFFSSDEGQGKTAEECETLFSSKSFSSDSSEFYQRPLSHRHNHKNKSKDKIKTTKKKKKESHHRSSRRTKSLDAGSWETSTGFRPLISVSSRELMAKEEAAPEPAEEERGFAVVKKSRDPYGDFRSSMVEMIADRQMLAPQDLESLLQSYLSLNAARHHPIILQAFSDIWEVLFSN